MLRRLFGLLSLWLLFAAALPAQDIPLSLRDWQGWVLHDVPQHDCPFIANQMPAPGSYECAWPGKLDLVVAQNGAHFSLAVHVDAVSWVELPGDERNWPQQVSANKQAATVLKLGDVPMLQLAPGDYQVSGELPWSTRPARLRVPVTIGLITLSVDGATVNRIERNEDQLTLGEAAAAQRVADALSLRVYRRLADGLPSTLQTQLQFNVTGSAREQLLGPVLPVGFVATTLAGDLPARLENDGRLRVQLRPGQWTLTLEARGVDTLARVALKLPPAPWPRQEIWSYADDTGLRSTRVDGHPVDAAQAGVPPEWLDLPAFAVDDDGGLAIAQGNRGDEGGRGDQLHLVRQMWLDFDGHGISIADHLSGELRHHQRLDVSAPWQLQRASQDGDPLLITRDGQGSSGIEVRDQQLNMDAGLRLPSHVGAMPSGGWTLPLDGIEATMHLPYGYRLLGALGADRSPDSWVSQWSLLDLFVLALIALLAGRLLGWPWAGLAAAYLSLAQHEAGAPLWTLAVTLALALLLRALPEGRLRLAARAAALTLFALTVLWTLPFVATQLQYALHPQLEGANQGRMVSANFIEAASDDMVPAAPKQPPPTMKMQMAPPPPAPPAPPSPGDEMSSLATASPPPANLAAVTVAASALNAPGVMQRDSHSVIQAGAGKPQWDQGNNYRLGWSGPVATQQTTRLLIAPAWLVRLLRALMVVLFTALLARLAQHLLLPLRARWSGWRAGRMAGMVMLALALCPHGARAQAMPSEPLLSQLRQRLTEAPKCAPTCAELAQAQLQVSADTLDVELEAHVGAAVALPLPQADDGLQLLDVAVDGHPETALIRHGDQLLLLRLDRGVHRLSLHYRIGAVDSATLRFVLPPQQVSFSGPGWSLDGVDGGRALGDSLSLRRTRSTADGKALATTQSFPPYVRLTRQLQFGLDWSVQNTVLRIAPMDRGFSISLPLLPGEHPLGDGLVVKDGRINVTFNAGSNVVSWSSRLDQSKQLSLKAPALGERAEVWQVDAAPMWHVQGNGVPTSASDNGVLYQPLPGEVLQLAVTRPPALAGDSLAFDNVNTLNIVGERSTDTTLSLQARSTRGGEHVIDLPEGVELLQAHRDSDTLNLALRGGKLSLPLLPGTHDYTFNLREPRGISTRLRGPAFDLHAEAANIHTTLRLPQDRWVLWTWGPMDGAAVLYWSQLVVLLLAAWLLARYAPTPLRFHHWLLLGLGFSAFAWSAYALVVAWLILLGLRARCKPVERFAASTFNLLQIGLAGITLLALAVLISAVPKGLLGLPDMHVAGRDSSAWALQWFADQSHGKLPSVGVFSVSLWVYKIAMLAWALWLANALIGWLRWAFDAWTHDGYWRKREPKPGVNPPQLPPTMERASDA